jgi:hypothetical protein
MILNTKKLLIIIANKIRDQEQRNIFIIVTF